MQLKSLAVPEGLGSNGSPFCWEPASLSLRDRGRSSRALCWVWVAQEIWTQDEEVATLGWTSGVFKVPGVKQGEQWSHSLCLPSSAGSVWQVGVEDRTSTAAVSIASWARLGWLPQLSPLGGQHPATARLSEWCPAPPPTPGITVKWKEYNRSSNLLPPSCTNFSFLSLCPYM